MVFELNRVTKKLAFAQYAEGYGAAEPNHVNVWVNITREMVGRMMATLRGYATHAPRADELRVMTEEEQRAFLQKRADEVKERNAETFGVLSELWGADSWPVDQVEALFRMCLECDPLFWAWLRDESYNLVFEHQGMLKKK